MVYYEIILLNIKAFFSFLEGIVLDIIFPVLGAYVSEVKVDSLIKEIEGTQDLQFYNQGIGLGILKELNIKEEERKKTLEDKAKTNVIAITIAITLLYVSLIMVNGTNTSTMLKTVHLIPFFVVLSAGVIYLITGGIAAFISLKIGVFYNIYLSDEIELRNETDFIRSAKLAKYITLNQYKTIIKTNYIVASDQCIKNGLLLLTIIVLLTIYLINKTIIIILLNFPACKTTVIPTI